MTIEFPIGKLPDAEREVWREAHIKSLNEMTEGLKIPKSSHWYQQNLAVISSIYEAMRRA